MTGIDIYSGSHGNPPVPIDWDAASSAEFVIVKLTEGTGYLNPFAHDDIEQCVVRGVLTMAYHFPAYGDPVAEADYFIANLPIVCSNVTVWLDLENPPGQTIPWDQVSSFAAGFISHCNSFGLTVGVYCNVDFYTHVPWLVDHPIWLADPSDAGPQIPRKLTQYGIGPWAGFPVSVDLDRCDDPDWLSIQKARQMTDVQTKLLAGPFLDSAYEAILGRAPDPVGYKTNFDSLSAGTDPSTIVQNLWDSPEGVAHRTPKQQGS